MTNGQDALDYVHEHTVDLVFLDEHMPGLSGLETLSLLKEEFPSLPVVMITKSEEEDIMDQAIGSKIADYLIKPVLPNQMLMSIKKNLHAREITQQQQTVNYQQVHAIVAEVMKESVNTLEALSYKIIKSLKESFQIIEKAEVPVYKMNPAIGGKTLWASVTMEE